MGNLLAASFLALALFFGYIAACAIRQMIEGWAFESSRDEHCKAVRSSVWMRPSLPGECKQNACLCDHRRTSHAGVSDAITDTLHRENLLRYARLYASG